MPHDGVAKRALSGAIRPHQGVDLTAADGEIDALENLLALDSHMEPSNDELFD